MHIEDIGGEQESPTTSQMPSQVIERQTEKQMKTTPVSTTENAPSPESSCTISESETKVIELETAHDSDKDQPSNQNAALLITKLESDNPSSSIVNVPAQSKGEQTRMEVVKETEKDAGNGSTVAADVSSQHNVMVPGVPDSSLQFQADWKRLRRDSNALTTYFKVSV